MGNNQSKVSNEIEIIYKIKENNTEKVIIFGYSFVKNNRDKCKIIYKNKEYELKEYFNDIDNNYNNKDIISLKLKGINNITNMGGMFLCCASVISISLPDISKLDTSNVEYMGYMFYGCRSLISLPDLSKWRIFNVKNMEQMLSDCNSLTL